MSRWLHRFVKMHQNGHFKQVTFQLCKCYYNKVDSKPAHIPALMEHVYTECLGLGEILGTMQVPHLTGKEQRDSVPCSGFHRLSQQGPGPSPVQCFPLSSLPVIQSWG